MEDKGILVNVNRAPGHADSQGNEEADRLAEAATKDADKSNKASIVSTKQDITNATRTSATIIWQKQWDMSEVGRKYYNHHPQVKHKRK